MHSTLSAAAFAVTVLSSRAFSVGRTSAPRTLTRAVRMASSSSDARAEVGRMNVHEFQAILTGDRRQDFQIIDVREANELEMVSLPGSDVQNLSLQTSGEWAQKVETGSLLDADKVATFLTQRAGFAEVYNMEGGIHQYALEIDPSIGTY